MIIWWYASHSHFNGGSTRYLFQASPEVYERKGKSVKSVCKKAQKDYQMYFMIVKKSRILSGFVIYSHFKNSAFIAVERDKKELGMWKGYHLSVNGIRKGHHFCQRWFIKVKGLDLGEEPRRNVNTYFHPPNWRWQINNSYTKLGLGLGLG